MIYALGSGAMRTLGGYGYLEDYGVAKLCRDERVCRSRSPTSAATRFWRVAWA